MAKRVNSYNLLLGLAREGLVISHSMACLWGSGDQLKQCGGDGEDLLEQQVVGKEYMPLHCLSHQPAIAAVTVVRGILSILSGSCQVWVGVTTYSLEIRNIKCNQS